MGESIEFDDVLQEFLNESVELLDKLEVTLEDVEDNHDLSKLEHFGQMIDRIMGAAKSVSEEEVGALCELGKVIGYKASQSQDKRLFDVVLAVLFDTIDILRLLFEKIEKGEDRNLKDINTEAFLSRMKWLSEKFKDIERSSISIDGKQDYSETEKSTQNEIDSLLDSLGF